MIEILSMPRRPTMNVPEMMNTNSGLPINALPGWENIPLNLKLPMLKCPGNQVIFSKNKIGQSFRNMKREFEPFGRVSFPEYNPLHDSNLRTFYANERNLKRLRQNGEITETNDVICTLKDFNEFREHLHKSYIYYALQELKRLEIEQRDRLLISNAESVTNRDHRNLAARQHSYTGILIRKKRLDEQKADRFRAMLNHTEEKFQRIAGIQQMRQVLIEHRKVLNQLRMQQHWEVCSDLKRKHLITQKKRFQFKLDRLNRNLTLNKELRIKKAEDTQKKSWESRLSERIANQKKMKILIELVETRKRMYIENHRAKYKEKWAKIEQEIRNRSRLSQKPQKPKRIRRRKRKTLEEPIPNEPRTFCDYQSSYERILDTELCEALNTAIDLEGKINLPFSIDDPIHKAATFIIKNIINKFDKDLSSDNVTLKIISERISRYFDEAKKFVISRATQLIASARDDDKCTSVKPKLSISSIHSNRRPSLPKYVSFSQILDTIGTSSYEIHPFVDVKQVADRAPTPAGSLASINVRSDDISNKYLNHLCRNERIYVEYYVIKFKRELIVGMGKRVFAAIHLHYDDKIMDVRKELLDIDRDFLVDQMAKAILSYATNPLNYEASIKLCVSALASDIVWSLQKHLLKPKRDPRGIVQPRECFHCAANGCHLCLYCFP